MADGERRSPEESGDHPEGFGEQLLGALLDQAHDLPPRLLAPLVAEEIAKIGGRDVSILLQDYDQLTLTPLPVSRLVLGEPQDIDGSPAGRAFLRGESVESPMDDGVRVYLPLLNSGDHVGVLALTLDSPSDDDRRLLRRLAGLVGALMAAKNGYTDLFSRVRRREAMTVAAEIQWSLLPPLSMTAARVAVAGILEPAYDIAGDSFDYVLNENILHLAVIDAMGHGLNAAVLATVAIGAYRHARRTDIGLAELYAYMDKAIDQQFGPEQFVTAQMSRLDIATGRLEWVNAGHPPPLLLRGGKVIRRLEGPGTLPVGFGGAQPQISELDLQPGDRLLFFTDGLVEERWAEGEQFGEDRLIEVIERVSPGGANVREAVRTFSHTLMRERGGVTTDDATLLLVEWRGGDASRLVIPAG